MTGGVALDATNLKGLYPALHAGQVAPGRSGSGGPTLEVVGSVRSKSATGLEGYHLGSVTPLGIGNDEGRFRLQFFHRLKPRAE